MKETIGYVMIAPDSLVFNDNRNTSIRATFLPMEQLEDGNVRAIPPKLKKTLQDSGFRPMVAVRSEVTRVGTKITHRGCELYLVEGMAGAVREWLMQAISPALIDSMLADFYS